MENTAFIKLMKAIEEELAKRQGEEMGYQPLPEQPPIEHIDFDSLPISEYTGLPYDPELISYPYGPPKPKRKFRLFQRREKPKPKQEHVTLFEALPDGPYLPCHCGEIKEQGRAHICLDRRLQLPALMVHADGSLVRVGDIIDTR